MSSGYQGNKVFLTNSGWFSSGDFFQRHFKSKTHQGNLPGFGELPKLPWVMFSNYLAFNANFFSELFVVDFWVCNNKADPPRGFSLAGVVLPKASSKIFTDFAPTSFLSQIKPYYYLNKNITKVNSTLLSSRIGVWKTMNKWLSNNI